MVSIIIPVYNAELYIDECLQSIINQSFTDWECILVNDGSTDNSGKLCDAWAERDSRIIVVHQKNAGASSARNKGIDVSHGKYLTFIDSDDWIEHSYLEAMMFNGIDADLVVSGLIRRYKSGNNETCVPSATRTFEINAENVHYFNELNEKFLLYGPCTKIYKAKIIKDHLLYFSTEYSLGEDLDFNYNYLNYVNTVRCISSANYNYRILGSNTLSSNLYFEQFRWDYEQWKLIHNFYVKRNIWLESAKQLLYRRLWELIHDGIFRYPLLKKAGYNYLKQIQKISEISFLKEYTYLYTCAKWIKVLILMRCSLGFYLYFSLRKLIK